MASGTAGNPTTLANWVAKRYSPKLDRLAYEISKLMQRCEESEDPLSQLVIPKFDNLTVSTRSDSTDIYEPTFVGNTEGAITASPSFYECSYSIDERTINRMIFNPQSDVRTGVEMALAQQADVNIATLFTALVTNPVGDFTTDVDLGKVLQGRSLVLANAKEYARGDGDINFAYHTTQDDSVMGIGNLVTWSARGTGNNAAASGIIGQGYGITFIPTTVIQASGGGYANSMFIKRGVVYGFNIRPSAKLQEHGFATWILGRMDQAQSLTRDPYSVLMKSR